MASAIDALTADFGNVELKTENLPPTPPKLVTSSSSSSNPNNSPRSIVQAGNNNIQPASNNSDMKHHHQQPRPEFPSSTAIVDGLISDLLQRVSISNEFTFTTIKPSVTALKQVEQRIAKLEGQEQKHRAVLMAQIKAFVDNNKKLYATLEYLHTSRNNIIESLANKNKANHQEHLDREVKKAYQKHYNSLIKPYESQKKNGIITEQEFIQHSLNIANTANQLAKNEVMKRDISTTVLNKKRRLSEIQSNARPLALDF